MEEVISNSHGTGLLIVNSDPIILNDAASINTLLNNNGNLIQGALNLLEPAPKSVADSLKLNIVNNDAAKEGDGGCIIVDGSVKLDGGNIIQLSIDDLNKLGLHLTFDNRETNCDLVKANDEAVSGDLFLSSLATNKDKLYLSAPDTVPSAQLEPQISLNVSQPLNITNFGSVLDENALKGLTFQQLEVVTPFENDNMTYTLQLDNGSSNILSRASGLPPATASVSTSNDTLIVSSLADHTSKKIALTDQLKSDGKYPQIFRINSKPTNIELKPKTFISKANLNGIQNNVLTKVSEDKTKLMKIPKSQSLIVKNRNNPPNLKLNQPNVNLNPLNNKTKRICILNKSVSGIQAFEKNENAHKLVKVPPESIINKTEAKPIAMGGGMLNSNHLRLTNRSEPQSPAASSTSQDIANKTNKVKRLTPAQLQQIAAYLEKNRDDQGMITNPSTFYDTETNTKIICRVVYPEDFENGKNLKKSKTPTKAKSATTTEKEVVNDTEVLTLLSFSRTRSGRLSRPPKHIAVGQNSTAAEKPATTQTDNADILEHEFVGDVSATKVNGQVNKTKAPKEVGLPKKGVSWKKKMKVKNGAKPAPLSEVLGKYSEVEIGEFLKNKIVELPLWECLLLKISSSPEQDKVRLLCDELTSFAKSVAAAADQFLKPVTPERADSSMMLNSDVLCALFKKNIGVYSSDNDALMQFHGDKRKREVEVESQTNKKPKSDFDLKKESSPLHSDLKKDEISERLTPTSNDLRDVKPSLDIDIGESVDEIVNQRLASIQNELVPSLGKALGDDLLSNLLSRTDDKKCDTTDPVQYNMVKEKVEICVNKNGGKSPSKFDIKNNMCGVKGSIDLDLGESVDELVNARLASLADEIVPSLPSRALGDDVLVGLLSDTSTSLFSHIEKTNTTSAPTNLLPDDSHSSSGIFSSLDKEISVSSSRSMLSNSQTASVSGLFSSIDKHVSPPALSDTQSSSDLFSSLEKRVSPSDGLLGDPQSSNSLFSSLDKSFPSPGSSLLMDAQSSSSLFSSLDKCISTANSSTIFPTLDKRVSSPSPGMLSSTSMFSSLESPTTSCSTKRGTSTSPRSLLRNAQNPTAMLPPIDKNVPSRSLLSDSAGTSNLYPPLDKRVSSTTSNRNLLTNGQTVTSTSDLFSPLDKRVSASTEDLIKSLENLSAEIPAPSSAPLQDFSVFSQHFSRESKTAI